jgi:hypothetical protein
MDEHRADRRRGGDGRDTPQRAAGDRACVLRERRQDPVRYFVPGDHRKDKLGQVGLEHSAGPRGLQQLRDAGVVLPAGWRMRQDHGKRGIVCDVPRDESPTVIVRWILDASLQLCEIDLTGWWTAVINVPK